MFEENNPFKIAGSVILNVDEEEMFVKPEQIVIEENGRGSSGAGGNTSYQKTSISDRKRHILYGNSSPQTQTTLQFRLHRLKDNSSDFSSVDAIEETSIIVVMFAKMLTKLCNNSKGAQRRKNKQDDPPPPA